MEGGVDCNADGKYGKACDFDGDDDYVEIGDNILSDLTSDWSVAMWVNPNDNADNPRWISLLDSSDNFQGGYMGNDKIYFRLTGSTVQTSYTLDYGGWYYVVWILDSGSRYVYVNGEEKSTSGGGIGSNATFSSIGAGYSTTSHTADGLIDEVMIFNRALTEDEVKALYKLDLS